MSGPRVRFGLETLAGDVPEARIATLRVLRSCEGVALDRGLVLFWPGPKSFTGEDVGEFQLHGGRAVVAAVLSALGGLEGFRLAGPGEFTRRAFENGRMDLTEAEALADLVWAETEMQRRGALARASGAGRELIEGWRQGIMAARALLEAEIDFGDEEGIGESSANAWAIIESVLKSIREELAGRDGEMLRSGAEIVVLGRPNAGKSSLVNALARREVSIVSKMAGTTRDQIEVRMDLGGVAAVLVDTAGLRQAKGVEREGVRRSGKRALGADILLLLENVARSGARLRVSSQWSGEVVRVGTMIDLIDSDEERGSLSARFDHLISSKTGEGVDGLVEDLAARLARRGGRGESAIISRARHRAILNDCERSLEGALKAVGTPEVAAEWLRSGAQAIGRLTGRVGVEDVLDKVFSEFCVGK